MQHAIKYGCTHHPSLSSKEMIYDIWPSWDAARIDDVRQVILLHDSPVHTFVANITPVFILCAFLLFTNASVTSCTAWWPRLHKFPFVFGMLFRGRNSPIELQQLHDFCVTANIANTPRIIVLLTILMVRNMMGGMTLNKGLRAQRTCLLNKPK